MQPITIFTDLRLTAMPKRQTEHLVTCSVAYNEKYKKKSGEQVDNAHFYNLEFWAHKGTYLEKYARVGARISVQAFPKHDRWVGKDGGKRDKITFKVNDFNFVDSSKDYVEKDPVPSGDAAPDAPEIGGDDLDGIPF